MRRFAEGARSAGLVRGALAFGALACTGCLFPGEDDEPKDIFPLAVGNTWIYADTVYYSTDSVITSTNEISIPGTREIESGGKTRTVFLSNSHAVGGPLAPTSIYVGNIGHANYNFGAELDTARVTGKSLHLDYPTRAGRRYATLFFGLRPEGTAYVPSIDTIDIGVIDPHHVCVVPAGTFACVQYRGYRSDGSVFATAYHAPGVGYLGSEQTVSYLDGADSTVREARVVRRLVSYTLH